MFSKRANGAVECTVWLREEVIVTPAALVLDETLGQPTSITGTSMRNDSR
jgi:hypothetical protein